MPTSRSREGKGLRAPAQLVRAVGRANCGPQVRPRHYAEANYYSKARLCAYWHQIDEVLRREPATVLEVGPGPGFVRDRLREQGLDVVTVDIDPALRPNVTAAAQTLPFADDAFDMVVCCQVLEHMPFAEVPGALGELARVADRAVLVSIPDQTLFFRFQVDLPMIGSWRWLVDKPKLFSGGVDHEFDGQHHWELGRKGTLPADFVAAAGQAGLAVGKSFRVFEAPFFRFYVLVPDVAA